MVDGLLWIPVTLAAATAQVFRNGAQASLTSRIGTLGATQVRFVFGLPFAVLFLLIALWVSKDTFPPVGAVSLGWAALGALAQIAGTALMLLLMRDRAFGVATAYVKTEPVVVALLGVLLLHDRLPLASWVAIGVVTLGVLTASARPGQTAQLLGEGRPIALGVLSGAMFGLSAIAFRAAIEGVTEGGFVLRSLSMLVISLTIQCLVLGVWLLVWRREALIGSLREWRASLGAGFLGAAASSGWFIAFSLTPVAAYFGQGDGAERVAGDGHNPDRPCAAALRSGELKLCALHDRRPTHAVQQPDPPAGAVPARPSRRGARL